MPGRLRVSLLILATLALPRAAWAQRAEEPPRVRVAITVGTLGLTDLQVQPMVAQRLDEAGDPVESAVLNRTIKGRDGRAVNGAVRFRLDEAWSLRVGGGLGTATLRQTFTGDPDWVADAAAVPATEDTDVTVLMVGAGLEFRIPVHHLLEPYLELGASLDRWRSDSPLPGGAATEETLSRFSGYIAGGGRYLVTDRLAAVARVTTRVVRTPLAPLAAGAEVGRNGDLVLTAEAPAARGFGDAAVESVRLLRFELGLSLGLGGGGASPPDRSGSDESTSAPDR